MGHLGVLFHKPLHYLLLAYFLQHEIEHYGIDHDGPLPNQAWGRDSSDTGAVEVPEVDLSISSEELQHHLMEINPMANSQTFGIDIYLQVVDCLHSLLGVP